MLHLSENKKKEYSPNTVNTHVIVEVFRDPKQIQIGITPNKSSLKGYLFDDRYRNTNFFKTLSNK